MITNLIVACATGIVCFLICIAALFGWLLHLANNGTLERVTNKMERMVKLAEADAG